jgi:LTXXQ motif family protein
LPVACRVHAGGVCWKKAAHLEALRKLKSAIDPLYAALSDEQKKTADQLMVGPMGIMGMGMM